MYVIDCRDVQSFEDLIDKFNKGFIESVGGKWNGHLDALNDYLSWPDKVPYEMVILGSEHCSRTLDFRVSERHEKAIWPLIVDILRANSDCVHMKFK